MAKPDPRVDRSERNWNRELIIVATLVGLFILIGAVYTLVNGPRPIPESRDTRPYVGGDPVVGPRNTNPSETR